MHSEQRVAHDWLSWSRSHASYTNDKAERRNLENMSDVASAARVRERRPRCRGSRPDPLRQWQHWYDEAVSAGVTEPNAMALSTVGDDGAPDVRYVLVRGVDELGLAFYTNLTSAKARQLDAHPVAAAAFGWLSCTAGAVRGSVERVADGTPTPTSPRGREDRRSAPGPRRRAT